MTLWQWLVTQEKALFKSATLYVSVLIGALPDIADFLKANWMDVAQYIPEAWHSQSLKLIGLVVFLARLRSLIKVPQT